MYVCTSIDLNPESFRDLELNKKQNSCGKYLQCYNMDGRSAVYVCMYVHMFLRTYTLSLNAVHKYTRKFILDLLERNVVFDEVIMNLPQTATEFLDVFIGLESRLGPEK
jgi:tRNA G37 N-methylase Trm5